MSARQIIRLYLGGIANICVPAFFNLIANAPCRQILRVAKLPSDTKAFSKLATDSPDIDT